MSQRLNIFIKNFQRCWKMNIRGCRFYFPQRGWMTLGQLTEEEEEGVLPLLSIKARLLSRGCYCCSFRIFSASAAAPPLRVAEHFPQSVLEPRRTPPPLPPLLLLRTATRSSLTGRAECSHHRLLRHRRPHLSLACSRTTSTLRMLGA